MHRIQGSVLHHILDDVEKLLGVVGRKGEVRNSIILQTVSSVQDRVIEGLLKPRISSSLKES
jgi:hypothetical protein